MINKQWDNDDIENVWIKPTKYVISDNILQIGNDTKKQKQNWSCIIYYDYQPMSYVCNTSKSEPTNDIYLSTSQYRDKYYTYDIKLSKYVD